MFLLNIILSNEACILLVFIFLLIIGVGSYAVVKNHKIIKATIDTEEETKASEITERIESLFKQLNCQFSHKSKDDWHEYNFKFQTGNFILICQKDDDFCRIHYPHFLGTSIEHIHMVRQTCNECNSRNFGHHLVYTVDGKNNNVAVHITSSITILDNNEKYVQLFADNLSRFFSLAQDFYLHFEQGKKQAKDIRTYDIEEDYATYEREFFLLRESEIQLEDEKKQVRSYDNNPLSMKSLLRNLYDWKNPDFLELKIVNHETQTLLTQEEISQFDISSALVAKDTDGKPQFIGSHATLILIFFSDKGIQQKLPSQLTIALQSKGRTPESLYMRATVTTTPEESHNKNAIELSSTQSISTSFMFAYDTVSTEQKRAQLKFLTDELKEKLATESFDKLSAEEQIVYNFNYPNLLENIQYGAQLYRQKRYYEAISQLESVYNCLSGYYHNLNKKQKQYFNDICYYIGASYSKLELYKKAYFYLDAIFALNNYTYMEEYVNCLVNGKDHRALGIIENLLSHTQRQIDQSMEETPETLIRFNKFLLRRKAHALVNIGLIDEAKEIYEAMLNDPESQDFALNELAYIQNQFSKDSKKDDIHSTSPEVDNNNSNTEENNNLK